MKKQALLSESHSTSSRAQKKRSYALASPLLVALLLLGGCNKGQGTPESAPPPAVANQTAPAPAPGAPAETTPTAPAPANVTPAPAPAAPAPTPAPMAMAPMPSAPPPPPPPVKYTVPAGTPMVVRLGETISSKTNNVGDTFSGTLAQSVSVHGVRVLRAGIPVTGTVVAAKGQGRFKGAGDLGISIRRVGEYSVATTAYEKTISGKGKRTAGFIGGGGGGGALIGGLAGGGKGALIGGLIGAGAGTAGAAFTGNKEVTIPAETVVTFNTSESFTVTQTR